MRFLIDRCAGRRLADWLRQQGHDVVESRERGRDPGDRTLLEWAAAEERVLVTMDKDFTVRGGRVTISWPSELSSQVTALDPCVILRQMAGREGWRQNRRATGDETKAGKAV